MGTPSLPFEELLCNVADNRGKTCPTSSSGMPLIATNCISNDLLYPTKENVRYVDANTYSTWFRDHPVPGDIILVLKGAPGRCALVPDPVDFCIAQDMVAIRADRKKVDPLYLFAVLRSPQIQPAIDRMHVGTMIPHFKKGDFNKLYIPLPDRSIQKSIGALHMALVQKAEVNRRMNATLHSLATSLFNDWFVEFGPTKRLLAGQPTFLTPDVLAIFSKHLGSDNIPTGWRSSNLGKFAVSLNDNVDPTELDPTTPYIGLEHMPRRSVALSTWGYADKVKSNKSRFRHGDILFGKLRPYFHKVGIAPVDGICSTDIIVVRARSGIPQSCVLACMSGDAFVEFSDKTSDGTKMPRTSWSLLASYKIALPPAPILDAFDHIVGPLLGRIMSNVLESRKLSAARDFLLPRLIAGEMNLSVAEKHAGKFL